MRKDRIKYKQVTELPKGAVPVKTYAERENKTARSFTIKTESGKYRTMPMSRDEFNEAQHNTGDYRDWETDRKSTRLNSSHSAKSRMPSSA